MPQPIVYVLDLGQRTTMQRRIVKDEQAVSPVIAVILMVAITVVLAAVLYVGQAVSLVVQPRMHQPAV